MSYRDIADLLKAAAVNWVRDYAQSMGAALAFYTMFSIAPLLLIVISVAGLVVGEEVARGEIYSQIDGMLGSQGALAVQGLLDSRAPAGRATAAGCHRARRAVHRRDVGLRRAAGCARSHLAGAGTGDRSPGLWGLLRARLLSFGMILGIGFLLMVSLAFSAGLAALNRWWDPLFDGWTSVASAIDVGDQRRAVDAGVRDDLQGDAAGADRLEGRLDRRRVHVGRCSSPASS